jgi:ribosome biogenesis protein ERB1
MKLVQGIQEGRIQLKDMSTKRQDHHDYHVYSMWLNDNEHDEAMVDGRKGPARIHAPKMALPGHAESYNPPDEYLFSPDETKAWYES